MARGPRKWTEKVICQLTDEGRGRGSGAAYRPWIEVGEFSSMGNSRRIFSRKTGRTHHLFSNIEYHLFLLLEWSLDVTDIREQYPLDRDLTQEIAMTLGIRHPHYPGTRVPTVMTADVMATLERDNQSMPVVFNAKPASAAEIDTEIEKLEIQRAYFDGMEIAHHLVFDSLLPAQKIKNIEWIRDGALRGDEEQHRAGLFDDLMTRMAGELSHGMRDQSLAQYCQRFDARTGQEPGTGLRVARMLLQSRRLVTDLANPNLPNAPIGLFRVPAREEALRAAAGG